MIVVRTLMGLLFVFGAAVYFFDLVQPPPMEGPIKSFTEGLAASGYFFTLLKGTELICGALLVIGRFVPLALIVLAPIVLNILMVHIFLDRSGLPVAIILVLAGIFVAYSYRERYSELLRP